MKRKIFVVVIGAIRERIFSHRVPYFITATSYDYRKGEIGLTGVKDKFYSKKSNVVPILIFNSQREKDYPDSRFGGGYLFIELYEGEFITFQAGNLKEFRKKVKKVYKEYSIDWNKDVNFNNYIAKQYSKLDFFDLDKHQIIPTDFAILKVSQEEIENQREFVEYANKLENWRKHSFNNRTIIGSILTV